MPRETPGGAPILEVDQLQFYYPVQQGVLGGKGGAVKAVDGVSFSIFPGETLGLVGESGCGKSTVARCLVRLLEPAAGRISLLGRDITHLPQWRLREVRREVQLVFQDPAAALNPRMTVRRLIAEPMVVQGKTSRRDRIARVNELLDQVGLPSSVADHFAHELSGGQRQRVCIARALSRCPKLLVLDEPVSALDVSVQSQVLNLLLDLQRELQLAYLFISHDLSVVRHMSDRVAVMYFGKIVESADADQLYSHPLHGYTRALLAAVPRVDVPADQMPLPLPGDVPDPQDTHPGSAFGRRIHHPFLEATYGMDLTPREIEPGHWVAPDPCALSQEDLARLGIDIYS